MNTAKVAEERVVVCVFVLVYAEYICGMSLCLVPLKAIVKSCPVHY